MNHIDLQNILFLDIETVSSEPNFDALSGDMQKLWADKTKWQRKEDPQLKNSIPSGQEYKLNLEKLYAFLWDLYITKTDEKFPIALILQPRRSNVIRRICRNAQRKILQPSAASFVWAQRQRIRLPLHLQTHAKGITN